MYIIFPKSISYLKIVTGNKNSVEQINEIKPTYASRIFFSFFFFKNDGVLRPFFFFLSFLGDPSEMEWSLKK